MIDFYEKMKFEGLTEEKSITDEVINIFLILSDLLDKMGDEVTRICIKFAHDTDALALLVQYLFPLIVANIVLIQQERTFETDGDGNVRQTFRFRQQVSQASLTNLLG